MSRHYRQALIYLNGLDWMIRNGQMDPKLREQAEAGYYKKAFEESEDVALEKLLDEREGLLRDYEAAQEISRSHGIQLRDSF